MKEQKNKTRIVTLDIENSPSLGYSWGKYDQNILAFEKEWWMLSFAYKWMDKKKVQAYSLPDFKNFKKDRTDDSELIKKLWEVFDEADIVIGHNVDRFDVRKTNARFLSLGLKPPSPYKTIDTYKVAKKYFFLNSNKLTDLAKYLGLGQKEETGGFQLWLDCMAGVKRAWKQMVKYNKHDVALTEEVYHVLKPWITNHPNLNLFNGTEANCPKCSSSKLQRRGYDRTRVSEFQRVHCQSCGGWSRFRLAEKINKPEIV